MKNDDSTVGWKVAKKRWNLLADALAAKRSFTWRRDSHCLQLFAVTAMHGPWCEYAADVDDVRVSVMVRHVDANPTARRLMGFDNTGNVRIWPSEEVLAYLLVKYYGSAARGKSVLEVGGGMTCLASLMLAKYCECSAVRATDGNRMAVENVRECVLVNGIQTMSVERLLWSEVPLVRYDVIVCADCLFFDEGRMELTKLMWYALNDRGFALVVAPNRNGTLAKFVCQAERIGFRCIVQYRYDKYVWSRHVKLQAQYADYNEDKHYPLVVVMRKGANSRIIPSINVTTSKSEYDEDQS